MNISNRLWALGIALLAAGCVETKDEYTLNPDGTGKVKHEAVFQPVNMNLSNDAKAAPAEELKTAARQELEKAEGVEAWSDVKFTRDADNRVRFTGTAYFRDLAKLKFHNNGFQGAFFLPSWKDGMLELKSKMEKPKKAKKIPQTDAEMTQAISEARAQYQQAKPMMAGILGAMKADMSFRLPGAVTESSNLQRDPNGSLRAGFTGEKFIEIMDKLMADDARLREQLKAGRDVVKGGPEMDLQLNQQLFGEAKPVRATVAAGGKPLFDFAVEVAAAKKEMPAIFKSFGTTPPVPIAPAASGVLKSVTVGGVRWVRATDTKRGIRPFNWEEGFTLSVIAELPGSALKVTKGEVEKAQADNGTDLLPEKEWDRKIHFPSLSEDRTAAVFDVKLASPSDTVKGFKEISGRITYLAGEKTKKIDAGFPELTAGAAGKEFGAIIKSINPSQWEKDTTNVELELAVKREVIKSVEVFNSAGQALGAKLGNYSSNGKQTTLTVGLNSAVPKAGKIVVEMYEELQQFDAPFVLKNITLLGQPLP